ncbi:MAG TPA: 3-hydroxyacyl-CoA dehydrogenase NAD-binding domain-containing protein [Chitinophagaceae bacterium]|nr:3-hydroxyacyl-CoA dehydrogenase NAD-binding domain-containing protein [Chitinophagaceae bacterium]
MGQQSFSALEKKTALALYQKVTIIGAGAIGISWAALFLANGLKVTINDPRPDLEEATLKGIEEISPSLKALGYNIKDLTKNLSFEKDLDKAVKGADLIQENGPENVAFKQDLYARIESNIKPTALILSSSSGIPSTIITEKMKDASRVLIGHPFNPPHLIPLVEVVPGARTSKEARAAAIQFYTSIGKTPIVIEKETPGFVANRLQAALMKESTYLVSTGVVSMENLDRIVSSSIGLRWAAAGPFKTFTLGGGPGGLPHFLKHLGPGLEQLWAVLGNPHLDQPTNDLLIEQVNNSYAKIPYQELAKERDEQQLSIMKALGK